MECVGPIVYAFILVLLGVFGGVVITVVMIDVCRSRRMARKRMEQVKRDRLRVEAEDEISLSIHNKLVQVAENCASNWRQRPGRPHGMHMFVTDTAKDGRRKLSVRVGYDENQSRHVVDIRVERHYEIDFFERPYGPGYTCKNFAAAEIMLTRLLLAHVPTNSSGVVSTA